MRVALGSDHAGVVLKTRIKQVLDAQHHTHHDFGPSTDESVDYPDYAVTVAESVASGSFDVGILVCGSGVGMSIAANKIRGIRAAAVTTADAARLSREHNDANILTLGARMLTADQAQPIVEAFVATPFAGGRHQRRVDKITAIENGQTTASPDVKNEDEIRTR